MKERRKWLRDTGILVIALIAIIGIAVAEQGRDDITTEIETVTGAEDVASETASPSEDRQCGGYRYKILTDDTVEVTAYEGSETTLFIPAYMEDKAVTVIGTAAFKGNETVQRIYLPPGALEIGEEAFAGCKELQDIYITETVERIGERAMAECPLLEEIVFPEAVSRIESMTCQGDTGLRQITIQPAVTQIAEDAFAGCDALRLVYGESGFAQGYAQENDFVYVDMERIREEGNLVW